MLLRNCTFIHFRPDLPDTDSESRQNNYNFQQQYYNPQIIPNPSGYISSRPSPYHQNYAYRPEYNRYPPQPSRYPQLGQNINRPQNFFGGPNPSQDSQQSFMDILETVAANDELQCVSKILCEMSAGRKQTSSSQQSFINLESLLT